MRAAGGRARPSAELARWLAGPQLLDPGPARAALLAAEQDRLREFSLAAFRRGLGEGGDLRDLAAVVACASDAGIDADAVARGVERPEVKQRLREATDSAIARGVTGVPTVAVGDELFWGDDRLEDAATALAAS